MAQARKREHTSRKVAAFPQSAGLSSRPAWQGTLRLSLVTCAVGLYRATTTENDIAFHLINPKTGNRIRTMTIDPETGPVERSALVKGYEIDKGKYVTFTDEELRSVRLETTDTLSIERFVDAATIDRLYWDTPYILVPKDKGAAEAYNVIRQAMVRDNRVALGRVVMHARERLLAIEPRDNGLLGTMLRTKDEVVNTAEALGTLPAGKADKQMVDIAQKIIEQLEGPFDPAKFTDRYEDALRELIEQKRKGHKVTRAPDMEKSSNVIDLMDALKKSLGVRGKTSLSTTRKATSRTARR